MTVKDRTTNHTGVPNLVIKAGTPLTLTAWLESKVVDGPGQK